MVIAFLVLAALAWSVPLPAATVHFFDPQLPLAETPPALQWPGSGQAALGAKGYGILETHGEQTSVPTASVAKIFTALAVLKQKPLNATEPGPVITITQQDVDSYNSYYAQGGSLVAVSVGEQLTERQALEALLLPSANNMADTLARWAFGSVDSYMAYANQFNSGLGLTQTHIADASGFSAATVSSAADLVKIGQVALGNPALASIISEQEATVPVAGLIHNTNWLLGVDSINGIKTGNTDEAGGVLLFSADKIIEGKPITVIGAVMGAPSLQMAMASSRGLLASANSGFVSLPVLKSTKAVGLYKMAWGKQIAILPKSDASVLAWYKKSPALNYSANDIGTVKKNEKVGYYYVNSGVDSVSINLVAGSSSGHAPWRWRLYQRYL